MQINPQPDGTFNLMIGRPIAGTDAKMLGLHSRHQTLEAAIAARDKLVKQQTESTSAQAEPVPSSQQLSATQ